MHCRSIIALVISILLTGVAAGHAAEIHTAAQAGNVEKVKELLSQDPALIGARDNFQRTPLHWACRGVHFELVNYLVEQGADANAADVNGITPLHSVASRGHREAARVLIDKGARIDQRSTIDLSTPLHYAAQGGYGDVVSLLLESGARTDAQNIDERTPLYVAVQAGQAAIVAELLKAMKTTTPAAINLPDFDGNTALHLACGDGKTEIASSLINSGADINVRNAVGQTPFNKAAAGGHTDMADLLAQNGADQSPPQFPLLTGPYLGQTPPDTIPRLFAKGIVSTSRGLHANIDFSPRLDEACWTHGDTLYFIKIENGTWNMPKKLTVKAGYSIDAPFYSFDGDRLYFVSGLRDSTGMMNDERVWFIERRGQSWSEPALFDSVVNAKPLHWQISMDRKGNVYTGAGHICCAQFENGAYHPLERLSSNINAVPDSAGPYAGEVGPFISPDGDYLIFNRFSPPPAWSVAFLISFRKNDGGWTDPIDLGERLGGGGMLARVSPDGKYLFFLSDRPGSARERSIYWVDAAIINDLRPADAK